MKFQKLLHPEVVLGKRGNPHLMEFYRKTAHQIKFTGEGGMTINDLVAALNKSEHRALALMQRFRIDQGKVFHVNRDFLQALERVERKVDLKYLPDRFVGYISFAEGTIFDEADEIEGAYVYIGPPEHTPLRDTSYPKVLWAAYVCKDTYAVGTVLIDIRQGEYLEDLIARVEFEDKPVAERNEVLSKRSLIYNTLLNCVMYVHSAEPNIQRVPHLDSISNSKASEIAQQTGLKNACSLPITFLNWNYAKQRIYTVESTWVESHPRWQPCGPNRSQIKLIWVQAHERHYGAATT